AGSSGQWACAGEHDRVRAQEAHARRRRPIAKMNRPRLRMPQLAGSGTAAAGTVLGSMDQKPVAPEHCGGEKHPVPAKSEPKRVMVQTAPSALLDSIS